MIAARLLISLAIVAAALLLAFALARRTRRRAAAQVAAQAVTGQARLLYLRGPGCPACLAQARILEQLEPQLRRLLDPVDITEAPEVAQAYGVLTLPTTIVIGPSGQVHQINHGLTPLARLVAQLEAVSP